MAAPIWITLALFVFPAVIKGQGLTFDGQRLTGVRGKTLASFSLDQCVAICSTFPQTCFAVDYHTRTSSCIAYDRDAVCGGSLSLVSGWVHNRRQSCAQSFSSEPSQTVFSCPGSIYFEAGTLGSGEGGTQKLTSSQTTLTQCLGSCMRNKNCFGVDYDLADSSCAYSPNRSSSYNRVQMDYTRHYTKLCNMSDISRNSGVTDLPGSTLPPSVDHALAGYFANDGPCPAHFQRIEGQIIGSGTAQPAIRDLFSCRVACFLDSKCLAFEWNKVTSMCTILDTIDPSGFSVSLCCDHYRKNVCENPSCYFQNTVETPLFSRTDFNNLLLPSQIPDLSLETCPRGLCLIEYTIDTTKVQPVETVRRRCESVESRPLRECSITSSDPAVFTYKCVCRGNRCNSYSYLHYQALFAYLPLDGSAEDFSAFHRSPNPNHDVVNVAFDGVDRKKNSAAFFNGSSFIQINSFGQVTLGEVAETGPDAGTTRAGLTVAMWMKRTGPIGVQTLLSNGLGEEAPVLITSFPVDVNSHNITAKVGLRANDGQVLYLNVNTLAAMNKWEFLAVQVMYDVLAKTVSLSMWVTEDQLATTANAVDSKPFPSDQLPLKTTVSPMCLGKQFNREANQVKITAANHFVGFLDEVRIFVQGSISLNALQAMIDETKPL